MQEIDFLAAFFWSKKKRTALFPAKRGGTQKRERGRPQNLSEPAEKQIPRFARNDN